MVELRKFIQVLIEIRQGTISIRRLSCRSDDNIKMDVKREGAEWRDITMVMDLRVP
jgi:hypothetical protein